MNKKGFTLMEILVSALILALVMTGMANIFLASRRHLMRTRSKIQAAELGRLFLAPLQMGVRQDTWADSNNVLHEGTWYCDGVAGHTQQPGCPSEAERTLDGIIYKAKYTINRDNPIANVNKVKVDITWTEPSS